MEKCVFDRDTLFTIYVFNENSLGTRL